MLSKANQNSTWRRLYGKPEDGKFKDVEIILRSFALLCNGENYNGSMNVFINRYAKEAMNYSAEEVAYLEVAYLYDLFVSFLKACDELPRELFTTKSGELNAALFDSVFTVVASESFKSKTLITRKLHQERIGALKDDPEFEDAITHSTSHTKMVNKRIEKARAYLQ